MTRLLPLALIVLGPIAVAQTEDAAPGEDEALMRPPQISSEPGEVHFEAPPEDREEVLEAVVTGGQTDWRLPDLGSEMRAEQDSRDPNERIDVSFLYLYDPENPDAMEEMFPDDSNPRSVGFLEVIRLQFGERPE